MAGLEVVRKERRVHVALDCWLEVALRVQIVFVAWIHVLVLYLRWHACTIPATRIIVLQYSPPAQCQAEAVSLRHPV